MAFNIFACGLKWTLWGRDYVLPITRRRLPESGVRPFHRAGGSLHLKKLQLLHRHSLLSLWFGRCHPLLMLPTYTTIQNFMRLVNLQIMQLGTEKTCSLIIRPHFTTPCIRFILYLRLWKRYHTICWHPQIQSLMWLSVIVQTIRKIRKWFNAVRNVADRQTGCRSRLCTCENRVT